MRKDKIKEDIYFSEAYGKLYLEEGDQLLHFEFRRGDLYFENSLIKRQILKIGDSELKREIYDAHTPYGYGGYTTNIDDPQVLNEAFEQYISFCKSHKIINEFLRFHPDYNLDNTIDAFLDFSSSSGEIVPS